MQQPGQPGQDLNAGVLPPKGTEQENAQALAAKGANNALRSEAGLPTTDTTKETPAAVEPSADVRLRAATPGLDAVPTTASEVNRNARFIDNMGGDGPVRVRPATFNTADGQTLTGNVYPRKGNDVFMSSDGHKYTVQTSQTGDISLVPRGRNAGAPLAVQDSSIMAAVMPKPVPKVTDATAPAAQTQANAAALNDKATATILQAQQQQLQLAQQALLAAQQRADAPATVQPVGQPIVPGVNTGGVPGVKGDVPAPKTDQPMQPLQPMPTQKEQLSQAIAIIQQQQAALGDANAPRTPVIGSGSPDVGKDVPKPMPVVDVHQPVQPFQPQQPFVPPGQIKPDSNIKVGDAIVHMQPTSPNPNADHPERPFDKGGMKPPDKPPETTPVNPNANPNNPNNPMAMPLPPGVRPDGAITPTGDVRDIRGLFNPDAKRDQVPGPGQGPGQGEKVVDGRIVDGKAVMPPDLKGEVRVDARLVDGKPVDVKPVDGRVVDGKAVDGKVVDGKVVDGKAVDGKVVDGKLVDGKVVDGKLVDGKGDLKTAEGGDSATKASLLDMVSAAVRGGDGLAVKDGKLVGDVAKGTNDGTKAGEVGAKGLPDAVANLVTREVAAALGIGLPVDGKTVDPKAADAAAKASIVAADAALNEKGLKETKETVKTDSAALTGEPLNTRGPFAKPEGIEKTDKIAEKLDPLLDKLDGVRKFADTILGGKMELGLKDPTAGKFNDGTRAPGAVDGSGKPTTDTFAPKGDREDWDETNKDERALDGRPLPNAKQQELAEKEKERKKKEEEELEEDTSNSRNAMIAAMLAGKKKQAAMDKEEQLALNDSKKKGEDKRRRYVVKEKDTLESIAKKQLRDIRLAALIYEINKHMLPLRMEKGKQVAEPRPGTSIWLPSDSDIRDFRGRLYSSSSVSSGASSPAPPRNAAGQPMSANEELTEKFGQNWDGRPGSSAISANMMGAAVAKSQVRQSNIEKVLGPIAGQKSADTTRIRYIVRLSDTIDGVALKHPALKDLDLWPLLAQLNDLTDDVDANGKPKAELRRGMVLDIPTPSEIEAFRSGEEDDFYPQAQSAPEPAAASYAREANTGVPVEQASAGLYEPTVKVEQVSQSASGPMPMMPAAPPHMPQQTAASVPAPAQVPAPVPVPAPIPPQEAPGMPLPSSLFQSYQTSQPTMPLKAVEMPAAPIPQPQAPPQAPPPPPPPPQPQLPPQPQPQFLSQPQVQPQASAPAPAPAPVPQAQAPMIWPGAQNFGQQGATRALPQQPTPQQAPQQPAPQQPPQQPPQQAMGGWQSTSHSSYNALPAQVPPASPAPAPTPAPAPAPAPQPLPQQFVPQNPVVTSDSVPAVGASYVKPVNKPSAADIMKRAPIVIGDRYMWELDRTVRLVKSAIRWEPTLGVFRSQLEVLHGGTWYPVVFYEVFPQGAVRHEYVAGGKRKSVKMDLPPSAVQELADNDLVNNWQAYCQRFVTQLISLRS